MTAELLRSAQAPEPRTLVDILRATVEQHPDAPALDNGAQVLTYEEFEQAAADVADSLHAAGVRTGDRVGVRLPSGTTDLYVAIVGVLLAGAAYVPVDMDDPDERARLVFGEAEVAAVIGADLTIASRPVGAGTVQRHPGQPADPADPADPSDPGDPALTDDAWVIFTSGSTGKPKGVAVSHRSAAAFVDAESRVFLQDNPIGPGDRVMSGLSVAFDASCEEMWLAWRYGACLVPAPRSLVRSGVDLGPWLVANDITVVSTVPTLVALWPVEALAAVRLLILGGEACPPEIGARLARDGREVWNTYGPTEATVVACAAPLTATDPVRIGLPLDGWDLAVVDESGSPVSPGEAGELIIGGVGLARYLDPAKDAEKYAPMPGLGWERAYRSGDLVREDVSGEGDAGLLFVGRADDQVKLNGRRIELGEVDSALLALRGVTGAAAAIRKTDSGNSLLVGYVAADESFDAGASLERLRTTLPAPMVPRLARVATLPTRTSGKIDRDALPWPVPSVDSGGGAALALDGTAGWIQELWLEILGAVVESPTDDFFDAGGGSLTAAQLVSRLRTRFPEVTVADVYTAPTVVGLAALLDNLASPAMLTNRAVPPVPFKTQAGQVLSTLPLRALSGLRWLTWVAAGCNVLDWLWQVPWLPTTSWWWVLVGWLLLVTPPGRMGLTALGARILLRPLAAGQYPRGGKMHLRLWLAERLADELGAANLAGAPWVKVYARALGARIGRHVDLHSVPPVTGMMTLGTGCSIESEVDLTGHWLDGDVLHVGPVAVGAWARVGARSALMPGAEVGTRAEIAPGSAVFGHVPDDEYWSGGPARHVGPARGPWADEKPRNHRRWLAAYGIAAVVITLLPAAAVVVGALPALPSLSAADSLGDAVRLAFLWLPACVILGYLVLAVLIWAVCRALGVGLTAGHHPIFGRQAFQAWATLRLLDEARTWLFPLYSSSATPAWLRALGARIGPDVEASTVLLIPRLSTVAEGAFLADDTLLGGYELGGGWLRVDDVKIGRHAFLGNSGMAAPGRKVPRQGLVAVLSAAPQRTLAKKGTSWLGSPPRPLRRDGSTVDQSRTYDPPRRLRVARALVEVCRVVPLMVHVALVVGAVSVLAWATQVSLLLAAVLAGPVLMVGGGLAAGVTALAKWALVGRMRPSDHPLWSSFVWRNELADTFVEVVAAPWFARAATGTPVLNLWLRTLGARIGKGVWCETYWLPEADLIVIEDGVTVNSGCVVQTHLFHDRLLSMDTVTLRAGSTLGPNSVVLPAAVLGRHATVGPMSLVMRGESVPDRTRWIGNPIGPWAEEEAPTGSGRREDATVGSA